MDQVQWAVKELVALKEEHEKLGARIAKIEQLLQANEQQQRDPLSPSLAPSHPSVPPLNTLRNKEINSQQQSQQQQSQSQPQTQIQQRQLSSASSKAASSKAGAASVSSPIDQSSPNSQNSSEEEPPVLEEILVPSHAEEICSNVKLIGNIGVHVQIGLIAKTAAQMRHLREDPIVILSINTGAAHWCIAKTFSQLKSLDNAVRNGQIPLPSLPDKAQWQSFSPVKIDVRIDLLDSYFSHLQELVPALFPKAQATYAHFLSTDLVEVNREILCGFLVSKSRFSGWKPRFCVLNSTHLDVLDKPGGTVVQSIKLSRARVAAIADNITASDDEYRHGFSIVEPRDNSSKTTSHYFSAESQAVRSGWLAALNDHAKHPKIPTTSAVLPFVVIRERPSFSGGDAEIHSQDSMSQHIPSPASREKTTKRKSSLTLDFPPQSPFFENGAHSPRMSSHPSAIAITHHSSGPTSALAHRRVISPTSFSHSPLSASGAMVSSPRSSVFRVSLDDALGYSSVSIGNAVVPTIVGRCIEFLYSKTAYLEEGLFRISGTQSHVDNLEVRFERDDVDVDDLLRNKYDVHVVASVLKRYFRLLPEPLISSHEDSFWREVMAQDHHTRNIALREVVSELPSTSYDVLDVMTQFLGEVHRNSDVNKMTPQNLGIVFSPTLGIPGPVIIAMIEDQSDIFAS